MKKLMKMLLEDNAFGRSFVFNKGTSPLKLQPKHNLKPLLILTTLLSKPENPS